MLRKWFTISIMLVSGVLAWSQAEPTKATAPKPGADVFASYLYGTGNSSQSGGGILAGMDLGRIYKQIGLTAQFGVTNASGPPSPVNAISEWNVLVGPRFSPLAPSARIVPFADALIGTNTFHNAGQPYTWGFNNHTSLAWAFDGGMDVRLSRYFAVRAQAGYLGTSLAISTDGNPGSGGSVFAGRVRIGGGAVFHF